jgi:vacuolar protein sorting-associated protein 45
MAYGGASQRQEELFTSLDFFSRARSGLKGLKGVENVYTQHTPFLEKTLSNLTKGRLREQTHPFIGSGNGSVSQALKERPQDIVVFMVGGATYEEAKLVADINNSTPGVRVVLGGTNIHNSTSFLKVSHGKNSLMQDIETASGRWPPPEPRTARERLAART